MLDKEWPALLSPGFGTRTWTEAIKDTVYAVLLAGDLFGKFGE